MSAISGKRRRTLAALVAALAGVVLLPAAAGATSHGPFPDPLGDPTDTSEAWSQADEIRARVRPPTFPELDVDVTAFGADLTGREKSTDAFRLAIAAAHTAGGGRVVVPAGTYLTGAIHLRSNVNLHLEESSVVSFSTDKADFLPVVKTRFEGVELYNYSPFNYAYQAENIAVTGSGVLDGQAAADNWWDWKRTPAPGGGVLETADRNALLRMGEEGVPVAERVFGAGHFLRPNFVQFYESRNILLQGVTLNNSPMWLVHPVRSENVTVDGVTLESLGPNNDGVNPESSRDVVIKNTRFNTGDDCIAIKSGRNAEGRRIGIPSENILIEDNLMQAGHGAVVAGSEMSGGVRNVFAQNNVMNSPDLDRVVRVKTNSLRGGVVENIYVRDNDVPQQRGQVVWVDFFYEEGDAGDFTPVVRNIYVEDLHSSGGTHALYLRGYARSPVTNITISDSSFDGVATPMLLQNVQGLRLSGVTINGSRADSVVCQGSVWLGVPEVLIDSGVADRRVGEWCLSEQFQEEYDWTSAGVFDAYVARVTADLHDAGLITDAERQALLEAARQTDIGTGWRNEAPCVQTQSSSSCHRPARRTPTGPRAIPCPTW
ncbi:glycoside hydrolase family 28 protein [Actinopolymorpha sp. B11F2]|uniref:glycoside hydrolase family 28 protein n=1 Tax=Actinopolymorpha sp. B11F2 TaxID=3160862 RepID=UPI0032E3A59A